MSSYPTQKGMASLEDLALSPAPQGKATLSDIQGAATLDDIASIKPSYGTKDFTANDIRQLAKQYGLTETSFTRTPAQNTIAGGAKHSYHLAGKAIDFGGSPQQMQKFAEAIRDNYGSKVAELIHGSMYIKNGQDHTPRKDHNDHVHIAWNKGLQTQPKKVISTSYKPNEALPTRVIEDTLSRQSGEQFLRNIVDATTKEQLSRDPLATIGGYPQQVPNVIKGYTKTLGTSKKKPSLVQYLEEIPSRLVGSAAESTLQAVQGTIQTPALRLINPYVDLLVKTGIVNPEQVGKDFEGYRRAIRRELPYKDREGVLANLPNAFGGLAPYIVAEIATGGGATGQVATALLGASQTSQSMREDAASHGATPEQQDIAANYGAAIGLTAMYGAARSRKFMESALKAPIEDKVWQYYLKNIAAPALESAGVMGGQRFTENLIAKGLYDPKRKLGKGVGESAATGAILGATPAVLGSMGKPKLQRPELKAKVESNPVLQDAINKGIIDRVEIVDRSGSNEAVSSYDLEGKTIQIDLSEAVGRAKKGTLDDSLQEAVQHEAGKWGHAWIDANKHSFEFRTAAINWLMDNYDITKPLYKEVLDNISKGEGFGDSTISNYYNIEERFVESHTITGDGARKAAADGIGEATILGGQSTEFEPEPITVLEDPQSSKDGFVKAKDSKGRTIWVAVRDLQGYKPFTAEQKAEGQKFVDKGLPKGLHDSAQQEPNYVYRTRDIGEQGVPSDSHAQATSDQAQAESYLTPRGELSGKPQEVVKIDLNKLKPEDYQVMQHPSGAKWIKFSKDLDESIVEPLQENGNAKGIRSNQGLPSKQGEGFERSQERSGSDIQQTSPNPSTEQLPRGKAEVSDIQKVEPTQGEQPLASESEADNGLYKTAIKNSIVNQERINRGLQPIQQEATKALGTTYAEGEQLVKNGDATNLAKEIIAAPRQLSDAENAALLIQRMDLHNQDKILTDSYNETAIRGASEEELAAIRTKQKVIEALMQENDQAAKLAGTEWGRSGRFRQMMLDENYSLSAMKQRLRAISGKELSEADRVKIETLSRELEAASKELEARQQTINEQQAVIDRLNNAKEFIKNEQREGQRQKRLTKKSDLDAEFNSLKVELAQARKETGSTLGSGLASLDPEGKISAVILKMAKNRVRAGVNDAARLVEEIYNHIKDTVEGITQDDIKAIIAKAKNDSLLKAAKTRTANQEADLTRRIAEKDFSKKSKTSIVHDKELMDAKVRVEKLKLQFDQMLKKHESEQRGRIEKIADFTLKLQRMVILSGSSTLAKLTAAATGRILANPIESAVGAGLGKLPVLRKIAAKSPYEAGFNAKAERSALSHTFSKEMISEAKSKLLTGVDFMDLLHSNKLAQEPELMEFFGQLHGGLKTPAKINTYYRALEKVSTHFSNDLIKQGKTPEEVTTSLQDPKTQTLIGAKAYEEALRDIFMNDNIVSDLYTSLLHIAGTRGEEGSTTRVAGKFIQKSGRAFLPIVKIPTNFAAEATSYTGVGGYAKAAIQLGAKMASEKTFSLNKAISALTPSQADYIMRHLKKGTVGAALMAVGWFGYKSIGGFYQKGDERDKNKPESGGLRVKEVDVPKTVLHSPILEALQIGATARRVFEKEDSLGSATYKSAYGLAKEVPFFEQPSRMFAYAETPKGFTRYLGDFTRSMLIPPDVQKVAHTGKFLGFIPTGLGDTDSKGKPVKRAPEGFTQEVQEGIPLVRKKLKRRY